MLSEPGVVLSSPGGLAARCACEDMAENQWFFSKSIGLFLVANVISVALAVPAFRAYWPGCGFPRRFSDISRAVVQEAWLVVIMVVLLW